MMRINEDMMMYTVASSAGGTGFDPCGRQGKGKECAAPSPVQGSHTHVQVKNSGRSSPRGGSGGSPEPPS